MSTSMHATAILSAEDKISKTLDAVGRKFKEVGKNAKISAEVDRTAKAIARAGSQLKALDDFASKHSALVATRQKFRETQTAVEAAARAMAMAERPTRALSNALSAAQRDVSRASKIYDQHKDAVLGAKRAIESMGMPVGRIAAQQAKLRSVIDTATVSMAKQEAAAERRAGRRHALGTAAAAAGVYGAHKGADLGFRAITSAAEFDIGVRKQRVFTDISHADQGPLLAQAKQIGQETPYSNLDVVKAQTASMQGLPASFSPSQKAQVAHGITAATRNLALVMESSLTEASETIRTYLQTSGKDISTGPKATMEANKAVNQMVRAAKIGGMNMDDVQGYLKYAIGSGTAGGLSTDTMLSLGALARRGGLRGDEAGVFVRSTAGKLSSPTRGGLAALNAAGINYSDYQRAPSSLDVGRLEGQFQNQLGTSFSPAVRAALAGVLKDPNALKDQGAFTTAVTSAVGPAFGQKRGGGMKAADKQKIARTSGQFYKLSSGGVDAEGLLDAIMKSGMGLAGLNELLTGKHGGKGAITAQQWDDFKASRASIGAAGNDPDYAKTKADEIMGGLGGSLENLKGSFDNLITTIGTANEGIAKLSFDALGKMLDSIGNLSQPVLQTGTALAGLGAAAAGAAGSLKLLGMIFGGAPGGAAVAGGATAAGVAGAGAGAAATRGFLGTALRGGMGVVAGSAPLGLFGLAAGGVALSGSQYGFGKAQGPGSTSAHARMRSELDSRPNYAGSSGPSKTEVSVSGAVSGSTSAAITLTLDASCLTSSVLKLETQIAGALASTHANGPGGRGVSSPETFAGGAGTTP